MSRARAEIRMPVSYRFPPSLKERLAEAALEAGRSENAEVIARLEATFQSVGRARRSGQQRRSEVAAPPARPATIPPAGDLTAAKPDPKGARK